MTLKAIKTYCIRQQEGATKGARKYRRGKVAAKESSIPVECMQRRGESISSKTGGSKTGNRGEVDMLESSAERVPQARKGPGQEDSWRQKKDQ